MPSEILSARELEVLGLMAPWPKKPRNCGGTRYRRFNDQGPRPTCFEKLGVRTRTEAVARYQMF